MYAQRGIVLADENVNCVAGRDCNMQGGIGRPGSWLYSMQYGKENDKLRRFNVEEIMKLINSIQLNSTE